MRLTRIPNMSETGEEDLLGKVQAVEGKTGDEKPQICEIGLKERQALELPRILVTLKDYRMKLALGAGKLLNTSILEMVVELKAMMWAHTRSHIHIQIVVK